MGGYPAEESGRMPSLGFRLSDVSAIYGAKVGTG